MPDNAPVCRRCGRCCELGGPGLLRDDAPLLSSGALKPEMLVCLRRGQWARQDGMGGGLAQLEPNLQEIARIRLEHPDVSLNDLMEFTNGLGKSGISHRLKKLQEMAVGMGLKLEQDE